MKDRAHFYRQLEDTYIDDRNNPEESSVNKLVFTLNGPMTTVTQLQAERILREQTESAKTKSTGTNK